MTTPDPGPAARPKAKKLFPNPFYVLLLLSSTLFVMTTLGYLIGPTVREHAKSGTPSAGLTDWLDRRGPAALGVEFVVMFVSAFLAMATDHLFPERPARTKPTD